MTKTIRGLLLSAIVLASGLSNAGEEVPLDFVTSCDSAFVGKGNDTAVSPLSMTICPSDKAILLGYQHFPTVFEVAVSMLDLEYAEEIKANAAYSVHKNGSAVHFEQAISLIKELALMFVSVILGVQIFTALAKTLSDGVMFGQQYGHIGTAIKIATGALFLVPVGDSGFVVFGQVLLAGFYIVSLAMANMGVSTVLHIMQGGLSELPSRVEILEQQGEPVFSTENHSRLMAKNSLETSLCLQQTSLGVIADGVSLDRRSVNQVSTEAGIKLDVSMFADNYPSLYEVLQTDSGVNVVAGIGTDSLDESKKDLTCSISTYKEPTYSNQFGAFSAYNGMFDEHVSEAKQVGVQAAQSTNVYDSWLAVDGKHVELMKEANVTSSEIAKLRKDLASRFFSVVNYNLAGGYFSNAGSDVYQLKKDRLDISDSIAKKILSLRCIKDYSSYKASIKTIEALNSGYLDSNNFDLTCASVTSTGELKPFFVTDAKDENEFKEFAANYALGISSSVESEFNKLVSSFEITEGNVDRMMGKAMYHIDLTTEPDNTLYNDIRKNGFTDFGLRFLELFVEFENHSMSDYQRLIGVNSSYTATYDSNNSFLSTRFTSDLGSIFGDAIVVVPSFVYAITGVDSPAEFASATTILNSNASSNSGNNNDGFTEINNALDAGITSFEGLTRVVDHMVIKAVGGFYPVKGLDCSEDDFNSLACQKQNFHPITYYKAYGGHFLDVGASLASVYTTIKALQAKRDISSSIDMLDDVKKGGGSLQKSPKLKSDKQGRNSKETLNKVDVSGRKPTSLGSVFVAGMIGAVSVMFMFVGAITAIIMPMIPFFYYAMGFITWQIMSFQLMVIGPLLAVCLFVLSSREENGDISERGYMNAAINLTVRPMLMVASFLIAFILVSVGLYGLDLIFNETREFTGISGIMDFSFMDVLTAILFFVFAQACVMGWVFKSIIDYPDEIMKKLNADVTDASDDAIKNSAVNTMLAVGGADQLESIVENAGKVGASTGPYLNHLSDEVKVAKDSLRSKLNPVIETESDHEPIKDNVVKDDNHVKGVTSGLDKGLMGDGGTPEEKLKTMEYLKTKIQNNELDLHELLKFEGQGAISREELLGLVASGSQINKDEFDLIVKTFKDLTEEELELLESRLVQ
ncbi:TPA: hypothetical protein I7730_01370 [Vibrio vulnificus]|uniref:Uncharacterized protein n=1 Tax=Vibrio vulnificus TaxID=672 RepID=A0A8H9K5U6_VIBVL|nr:hypothetical protein [Vibrio vulnificus]